MERLNLKIIGLWLLAGVALGFLLGNAIYSALGEGGVIVAGLGYTGLLYWLLD